MDDFDKHFNRTLKASVAIIIVNALIGIGILGLIVWAVISLVNHVTA